MALHHLARTHRSVQRLIRTSTTWPRLRFFSNKSKDWGVGDAKSRSPACDPYELGGQRLPEDKVVDELQRAGVDQARWAVEDRGRVLAATFDCPSFVHALGFVNDVGNLSVNWNHVPKTISVDGRTAEVRVELQTQRLRGLSYNDLMIALRLDAMTAKPSPSHPAQPTKNNSNTS